MKTLAYLLYGGRPEYQLELGYSVLSALRRIAPEDEIRICLVADRSSERPDLPIEHLPLTNAELDAWSADRTYFHRIKPLALAKVLDHFGGPVALVDTDTFFVEPPAKLFHRIGPGRSVMHERESDLADATDWAHLAKTLRGGGFEVAGVRFDGASAMYNSGVIGMHPADRSAIEEMLGLLDALHARTGIFNVEQLAVGETLARRTQLSTTEDVVHHYWGFERPFIHMRIRALFSDGPGSFARLLDRAELPPVTGFPRKSRRAQVLARLFALASGWSPDLRFAYLASLSAFASKDHGEADAWARVAVDSVRVAENQGKASRRETAKAFARFGPDRIDRIRFLRPETRDAWHRWWSEPPRAAS